MSNSKHNSMLGVKIAHPPSTNYDNNDEFNKKPVKRVKIEHVDQKEADTEDGALESLESVDNKDKEKSTNLESTLPPIKNDEEAIAEYELARAADTEQDLQERLHLRTWVRGKSSIYVDAFNLALEMVLDEESHLFDTGELKIFEDWRLLSYEAQYL